MRRAGEGCAAQERGGVCGQGSRKAVRASRASKSGRNRSWWQQTMVVLSVLGVVRRGGMGRMERGLGDGRRAGEARLGG